MADHVIADAVYDSDAMREQVQHLGAPACIRPNPTRKRKKRHDRRRYKYRNVIERFFSRRRRCRRVATRYEEIAANSAGFVYPAGFDRGLQPVEQVVVLKELGQGAGVQVVPLPPRSQVRFGSEMVPSPTVSFIIASGETVRRHRRNS